MLHCLLIFAGVPSVVHAYVQTEEEGGGREVSPDGEREERQLGHHIWREREERQLGDHIWKEREERQLDQHIWSERRKTTRSTQKE